jgi:hypothetical protein
MTASAFEELTTWAVPENSIGGLSFDFSDTQIVFHTFLVRERRSLEAIPRRGR